MMLNYKPIWSQKKSLSNVEAHIKQYTEQRNIIGSTHTYSFLYAKNGIAEELHRGDDNYKWIRLGNKFLRKSFFDNLLQEGKKLRTDFGRFIQKIQKTDFSKLSSEELVDIFTTSYQFYSRFRGYFKSTRPEFLTVAELKLKKLITQNYQPKYRQRIFEILTSSNQLDDINIELLDWLMLILKNNNLTEKSILKHIYQHPWLVAHSYDYDEIIKFFNYKFYYSRKNLSLLLEEIKRLVEIKKVLENHQKILLEKLKNEEITYLSWLFRRAVVERMKLKGGWAGADFLYLPLYQEIAKRIKINLKDLYESYRIDEIKEGIKKQNPILSRQEINDRKNAYIFWLRNNEISFYSGKIAEAIIKRELKKLDGSKQENTDIKILKGQTASLGVAKGRVRVFIPGNLSMLKDGRSSFRQGEVLVTTMTQPNMVPIMKKAAAIVTDEGGITSHAAVIAREFGIPCIVGTGIATKIFKNNDLVEVDANKGIVKKLDK